MSNSETSRNYNDSVPNKGSVVYTVERGDSLSDIARKKGMSVDEIARINKIEDKNKIRVGQKLYFNVDAQKSADAAIGDVAKGYERVAKIKALERGESLAAKSGDREIPSREPDMVGIQDDLQTKIWQHPTDKDSSIIQFSEYHADSELHGAKFFGKVTIGGDTAGERGIVLKSGELIYPDGTRERGQFGDNKLFLGTRYNPDGTETIISNGEEVKATETSRNIPEATAGYIIPQKDRLGFALYAIQNIKRISMEEFNNYSMKDQKQIIESLSTKENHDKYIIYAMARDEEIQQKNEAYKASLPPTRYMTPEEQNQFYIENNIPARVATGNQSRWGRENRA